MPADAARLFCSSCQCRVSLSDLRTSLELMTSLVSNYNTCPGLDSDFMLRFISELQVLLDQSPHNKYITEEAVTTAILIVCLLAANLLIRHLVAQAVHLEDREGLFLMCSVCSVMQLFIWVPNITS